MQHFSWLINTDQSSLPGISEWLCFPLNNSPGINALLKLSQRLNVGYSTTWREKIFLSWGLQSKFPQFYSKRTFFLPSKKKKNYIYLTVLKMPIPSNTKSLALLIIWYLDPNIRHTNTETQHCPWSWPKSALETVWLEVITMSSMEDRQVINYSQPHLLGHMVRFLR